MVMSHDNKNFGENDSIFSDSSSFSQGFTNPVPDAVLNKPVPEQKEGGFLSKIVKKFIEAGQPSEADIQFRKELIKLAKENEDIFEVFNQFGCKLVYQKGCIVLKCPQLKLEGKITIKEDNTAEFDENTKRIMSHLANLVSNTNNLTLIVNEYEKQGFYPSGDLIKETIIYQGQSVEVLAGLLQNNKGETKKMYYYKGQEITPDE